MKFYIEHMTDPEKGISFSGEVLLRDVTLLNLDALDRMLMDDVGDDANAADHLLVLEMLFRRHAEQLIKKSAPAMEHQCIEEKRDMLYDEYRTGLDSPPE